MYDSTSTPIVGSNVGWGLVMCLITGLTLTVVLLWEGFRGTWLKIRNRKET